jgi:hypothetical protein
MSKSITGSFLLLIAALLYAGKYISASIMTIGMDYPGTMRETLNSLPSGITYWSLASLILGVLFLTFSEMKRK